MLQLCYSYHALREKLPSEKELGVAQKSRRQVAGVPSLVTAYDVDGMTHGIPR